MLKALLPVGVLCCVAWVLLPIRTANACSGLECAPDQFLPRMGEVPSNLPAIAWWSGSQWVPGEDDGGAPLPPTTTTPADLRFECDTDLGLRTVAFEVEQQPAFSTIRPKESLVAGEFCRLSSRSIDCDLDRAEQHPSIWMQHDMRYLSGRAYFYVTVPSPLPTSLGRFVAEPAILEPIELSEGAGCSARQTVCSIKGSIAFAERAHAWKDAFVYETWVDGERWWLQRAAPLYREQGGSYLGRGRDIFFAYRPGERKLPDVSGLSPGRHTVVFRARLPGTDLELATEPAEIDLNCFAGDAGAGEPDAGEMRDASATADAGEISDAAAAAPDGGPRAAERRRVGFSSSSCSAAPRPREGGGFACLALFAVGVLALRRRCA